MTAIFDIPLQVPDESFSFFTRPLADGLRASTASRCGSCAVIEYLDPSDERIFNGFRAGVACLGHVVHQIWAHNVFSDVRHTVEGAIPWRHGVSHDDVVVYEGPWAGLYECKSHSDVKSKNPSRDNIKQSEFRLRLRELAGIDLPGPMRLVMIGKAGNESGMVRGPWEVTLTDERRAEIDAQLAAIDELMARAGTLDLVNDEKLRELANGCRTCFPLPRVDSTPKQDDLMQEAGRVKRELDAATAAKKAADETVKTLKAKYETTRAVLKPLVPVGVVLEGITHNSTIDSRGALRVTPRFDAG